MEQPAGPAQQPCAVRPQQDQIVQIRKESGAKSQQPSKQQVPASEEDYYLLLVENESMIVVSASTIRSSAIKLDNNKQYIDMEVKGVQKKCRILMNGKE